MIGIQLILKFYPRFLFVCILANNTDLVGCHVLQLSPRSTLFINVLLVQTVSRNNNGSVSNNFSIVKIQQVFYIWY